jgi:hypothetical protein
MQQTQKTHKKPFQVTRIPALNGEWVDVHVGVSGNICIATSGYAEVPADELIQVLKKLSKTD